MAKKQILFVINNLNVGGAEKALVSLLQLFNYESYDVDVLLFKKEGVFLKQVPESVNMLPQPENYRYFDMPFFQVIKENFFTGRWNNILRRIQYKMAVSKAKNGAEAEQLGWKALSKTLKPLSKKYDVAIGFLQNSPNYYVIGKVKAEKKIGWIHNDYTALGMDPKYDRFSFRILHYIISVSENCVEILQNIFPEFQHKFKLIENINAPELIAELSNAEIQREFKANSIISVGRLSPQKNFSLAIAAASVLRDKGYDFEWNIVGEGDERESLEKLIAVNNLQGIFNLIGLKENPYPYIFKSLLYVQPSKFEGKSIAIDEAKILGKPIVVTNFATAKDQITNGENGLISEMNASDLASQIEKLLNDAVLRRKFSENLSTEDWETKKQVQKLYSLIEN